MKITKSKLIQIIEEELNEIGEFSDVWDQEEAERVDDHESRSAVDALALEIMNELAQMMKKYEISSDELRELLDEWDQAGKAAQAWKQDPVVYEADDSLEPGA